MNRKAFYDALRRDKHVFGTSLGKNQVRGMEGILDAFATHGDGRAKTLAYALATAYHEVGGRMVPVREGFASTDAGARRIVAKRKYGKPTGPYGHVYYGRGLVQLTWIDNYERSSKDAGVDLVKNPDAALDPVIGARILIKGLIDGRWNGRGKGIAHYLPTNGPDDLKNARRTVNITDKWSMIGGYYKAFLAAIKEAGGVPSSKHAEKQPAKPASTREAPPTIRTPPKGKTAPVKPQGSKTGIVAIIVAAVVGAGVWISTQLCDWIGVLCQ